MPNNTTQITRFQASENTGLSRTLWGLENQLETAARQNVMNAVEAQGANEDAFTDLQIRAMVVTEELRLVNGFDLAAILLRGKLISQIEEEALFSVHPNGYANLTHLAQEQGISISELSDIRSLTQIIFPWIEENLQVPVAQVWETVGKTKFRAMTPILKAMITGEAPDTDSARRNYERMLDTTAIDMRDQGEEVTDEAVRNRAARALIQTAGEVPSRELAEHIRDGNPTPALEPTIIVVDGRRYMISELEPEQEVVVRRKLGRHMADPIVHELPRDRRMRQIEAARIPLLRTINEILEG